MRWSIFRKLAHTHPPVKRNGILLLFLTIFLMSGDGIAQLAIGQWRDHLSYKKGISVTQNADMVYVATESGVFSLEKYDFSIDRLSKINGLSDVGVRTIRFNPLNNTLLLAYSNANIDLVVGNSIYNISDIKRALITGKKTINNIYFKDHLAYLACGFGIVVLDMNRREIKETYYIGVNGGYINIRDISSDASYIYAATDSGVYRASWASPNLADFSAWSRFTTLPKGVYNTIAAHNGKVYANFSKHQTTGVWDQDTTYIYDGTQWSVFLMDTISPLRKIEIGNNKLLLSFGGYLHIHDPANNTNTIIGSFQTGGYNMDPYQAITDMGDTNVVWIADNFNGLTKNYGVWNGASGYAPNGPNTSGAYQLAVAGEELWVARGDRSIVWVNVYNVAEAYRFSNETWTSTTSSSIAALDSMRDAVSVAIDPADKEHVYIGTLGAGVVELKNGALVNLWNETNSALQSRGDANYHWVGIFGMTHDPSGNLWMTNCYANRPLVVRKTDGTWQSFNFPGLATTPTISQIIVDQNNQKWMVLPRGGSNGGLLVFDENGTWGTGDDKMIKLATGAGKGNLPSDEIECIAEDLDGEIWVGTHKGIAVFFCPDQVLGSSGCDAQQIYITQDGHTQFLLETEIVTAIAIDGANRKWIGTQNSGVYLMSADGTIQIEHFTLENSPLLSNEIRSIVIHPRTGEVFFATAAGIISYRSDATTGLTDYTNVYVFPNPVKSDHTGPVAITGLVENADVKITDVSGALVYQTKALGGQAIWYGKNFNGEKVYSGVYLVYCTNEDGSKTFVTKILFLR